LIINIPEQARYEIKFVAYEMHLHSVLLWIKAHWAVFQQPYPDRWVNSIYFDTHDYHSFNENLSGASSRIKVRYRWYGHSNHPSFGNLEIKCKRNYFGWKKNFPVTEQIFQDGDKWADIKKNLVQQMSVEGKNWLMHRPFPVFINQYFRKYFVTRDGRVRITVDTNQTVWDQRYNGYPNLVNKTNIPKTLVVELKFDRKDQEYASEIIQGIPLRVSRNSKYIVGVRTMKGMRG
jgi:VTC domain